MTPNQLQNASVDELKALEDILSKRKDLSKVLVELSHIAVRIPYVCGNPDCENEGCHAVRKVR